MYGGFSRLRRDAIPLKYLRKSPDITTVSTTMKFEIEALPNCITNLRVEVPSDRVVTERNRIVSGIQKAAKLPGYRPGKVPASVVERKYQTEIREELVQAIASAACREAITEKKLKVLSVSGVEDVEFDDDKTMRFQTTLVTAPDFEMPVYKGLAVKVPEDTITDENVEAAIERLKEQGADFNEIEGRPLAMGDFAVVDYKATLDGVPLGEAVEKASKFVSGQDDFWIKMDEKSFLPGFVPQLVGLEKGASKEFDLELPGDFPLTELAGKTVHYAATVKAIKERVLPVVDDAFAERLMPGGTLQALRERIAEELKEQRLQYIDRSKKDQIMAHLLASVECELPEAMVKSETRKVMNDIVRENQERGVADEMLMEKKGEILATASKGARERVKGSFILANIAREESIKVTSTELDQRIGSLALRYRMTPEKLRKELIKRDALEGIEEEILMGKVLDFLASSASVEVVGLGSEPVS